jgi:VanZ family protein
LLWVVAEIIAVFILLSLPGSNFQNHAKWFGDIPVDKLVHIALFGSLAFSFLVHFEKTQILALQSVRAKAMVLLFCIVYGIGMEFYQEHFVPSRGFEVSDMLADAVGSLLALPFFYRTRKFQNKHKHL